MSKEPPFDIDIAHRWFGAEYNNSIFPLLEKADRTEEETEKMISMAYATTLHWSSYSKCKTANLARGEYMIATALAYAGRKESSLHHAKRNYEITFSHIDEMEDWDIAFSLMVNARAYALNRDMKTAEKFLTECITSIEKVKEQGDKNILEMDFNSGPWYGLK
ncbi:MAG: hypothetical protein IPG09_11775 [Ignavibacteria bacterium]|nr:hypothetical protein [Ignavibacteria bacterium]